MSQYIIRPYNLVCFCSAILYGQLDYRMVPDRWKYSRDRVSLNAGNHGSDSLRWRLYLWYRLVHLLVALQRVTQQIQTLKYLQNHHCDWHINCRAAGTLTRHISKLRHALTSLWSSPRLCLRDFSLEVVVFKQWRPKAALSQPPPPPPPPPAFSPSFTAITKCQSMILINAVYDQTAITKCQSMIWYNAVYDQSV
mgnify:CR=1 FL=1